MSPLERYLWIAVLGGILGFCYGFLIGANDVANAFASSISSKSITLKQAVLIATVCEFSGAFLLGASVTGTIRSKVIDITLYENEPALLMFGMFCAMLAANIWLWIATAYGYPVSTTHDIVGSIMGFSIAAKGFDSVDWKVVVKIFISWFISPLIAGSVGFVLFGSVKYFVLNSEHTFQRAYRTFPIVLTIGIGINVFYVLYTATKNQAEFQEWLKLYKILPIAFGSGVLCGLIWMFVVGPIAMRRVEEKRAIREANDAAKVDAASKVDETMKGDDPNMIKGPETTADDVEDPRESTNDAGVVDSDDNKVAPVQVTTEEVADETEPKSMFRRFGKAFAKRTYERELQDESLGENARAAEIWGEGEVFDIDTENLFTYLQVFTACLNSFAHGANDVSNTIAPMSAIIDIYQTGVVNSKATVDKWVLAYGGIAIVLGLLIYGYNVMKSVGYKLTMLTPSRGFSAELSSSLVVVSASFNELPVSSTQCIVGAIFGVGLVGGCKNVSWLFLLRVACGWVFLFFCATIFSAGIFSFGAFSPSVI